jgi:ribosomal protein S18 acetylase RimI-like enzyme
MMERALPQKPVEDCSLPAGYVWVPWSEAASDRHAEVLYQSFRGTLDALILPALASREECRKLIRYLTRWPGFHPKGLMLVTSDYGDDVACIQASLDSVGDGVIINLAVLPDHRSRGLGTALLRCSLQNLAVLGARRVYLEVTASNETAMRLYRRHGFRCYQTLYREVATPAAATLDR